MAQGQPLAAWRYELGVLVQAAAKNPAGLFVFLRSRVGGVRVTHVVRSHLTTHSSGRRSIACALTNVAAPAPLNSSVRHHRGSLVFTWLNKQGVRSDQGFEFQFTGR